MKSMTELPSHYSIRVNGQSSDNRPKCMTPFFLKCPNYGTYYRYDKWAFFESCYEDLLLTCLTLTGASISLTAFEIDSIWIKALSKMINGVCVNVFITWLFSKASFWWSAYDERLILCQTIMISKFYLGKFVSDWFVVF